MPRPGSRAPAGTPGAPPPGLVATEQPPDEWGGRAELGKQ
jgi:hypothetical protein